MDDDEQHRSFPSWLQAIGLVILLLVLELLIAAAFNDIAAAWALDLRNSSAAILVLGNGILFSALMHHKRLGYRTLFHPSPNSVTATIGTLAVPILLIVPGLLLAISAVLSILVTLVPMSPWQEAMFENMLADGPASIVTVCILGPVLEEMLFRGIILRSFLTQYSPTAAIVGSAAIFGLAHLNIYQFVVALALGSLSGWLYARARSLWPCILLHASYNSANLLGAYSGGDAQPTPIMWWLLALAMAWVGGSMLRRLLAPRRP